MYVVSSSINILLALIIVTKGYRLIQDKSSDYPLNGQFYSKHKLFSPKLIHVSVFSRPYDRKNLFLVKLRFLTFFFVPT